MYCPMNDSVPITDPRWRSPLSVNLILLLLKSFRADYIKLLSFINILASGWFWQFSQKNSSFRLLYQRPSSSADCARELFNGSNELASLVDCTRKKNFAWGMRVFCEWRHKWSSFRVILAHVAWPRTQPLGQSVFLKFSLKTRLESESFEPLIDFLTFLIQKLWSKINKLIN